MMYLLKRLFQIILITAVLSVALFGLLAAMPGNPVDMLITSNPRIQPEDVIRLKKLRGLDKPWYIQYIRWMWGYHDGFRAPRLPQLPEPQIEGLNAFVDVSLSPFPVTGILGAEVKNQQLQQSFKEPGDHRLWYIIRSPEGLEEVGFVPIHFPVKTSLSPLIALKDVPTQVIDEPGKFQVNLSDYLVTKEKKGFQFRLIAGPGKLSSEGIYTHPHTQVGHKIVQFEVMNESGIRRRAAFSLDQGPLPDPKQFRPGFLFVFTGNKEALGFSNTYKRPVWDLLFGTEDEKMGRIGNTLMLMFPALLLALLIALPLGIWSAYRQYSFMDYLSNFFAFVGISLPVFWFGIMVIYLFAEYFQWFPAGGMETPGGEGEGIGAMVLDRLSHAVLPIVVLSIAYAGRFMRYMRAAMLEILPADYIRTARAKGLSERKVILKHALRNAFIPIVTILTLSVPALFGGAVLTETVFSWPGIGRLEYDSVISSDYYVAIVVFLISSVLVMLCNWLADVLYVLVDPRIRHSSS